MGIKKWGAVFIVCATFLVYAPALQGGFFWDDELWITTNPFLGSWQGLLKFWTDPFLLQEYYPLTRTTHWLEHQLWQLRPFGYHLDNLLLHIANALLLWNVLSLLKVPGSWLAAVIFALHPVHVESVAWITERKNVLSCFFYLAALKSYLHFADAPSRSRLYYLTLVSFTAALLSKTIAMTLPFAIFLLLVWKRPRLGWREMLPVVPLLIMGGGMGMVTLWVEKYILTIKKFSFEWSFLERCMIAGRAFWFYLCKLLWPADLMLIYPKWDIHGGDPAQYAYFVSAMALLVALWIFRKQTGKAPLLAILFFIANLFPVLGFFDLSFFVFSLVEDHFQYHASMGIIALFSGTLTQVLKLPESLRFSRAGVKFLIPVVIITALGTTTWRYALLFRDEVFLWEDTLRKNPEATLAHFNLGVILQRRGNPEDAEPHYRKTIQLDPTHAVARNNLAVILTAQGKLDEAAEHLMSVLKTYPTDVSAHTNLGIVLARQGKYQEAVRHFALAVRLEPPSREGLHNLATAFRMKEDPALLRSDGFSPQRDR